MKVLLDHNVSEHLKLLLPAHQVVAAYDRRWDGWDCLRNGELIRAAESERFDVMVTGDKKLFYQQNNRTRLLALIVLSTTRWQIIRQQSSRISEAIIRAAPGSYEYLSLLPASAGPPGEAIE